MPSEARVPELARDSTSHAMVRSCAPDSHSSSSIHSMPPEHDGASQATASLQAMVDRVPEGWTVVAYEGRSYGLTRTTRVHGQSNSISAEELGGDDLISANVYRTRKAEHLRPCEVSEAKVLAFLREEQKYWLIPIVLIFILFAVLLVFSSSSPLGPFLYPLF